MDRRLPLLGLSLGALLAVGCGERDRAMEKALKEARAAADAAMDDARREWLKARLDALPARMDELRARMKLRMAEGDAESKVKLEATLRDLEARYAALKDVYARSEGKSALEEIGAGFERAAKELEEAIDRAFD